ncbi:MAG: hypothetical protein ABFR82_17590 [Nitrospirota bacterium]
MPNKKFIEELKELLRLRGKISTVQVDYARAEEKAMIQMYPITKPSEEKRFSHLRTLESYIGEHALKVTG